MGVFKIIYTRGESSLARVFTCSAESDGEAIEIWESFAEGCDDCLELVSLTESDK